MADAFAVRIYDAFNISIEHRSNPHLHTVHVQQSDETKTSNDYCNCTDAEIAYEQTPQTLTTEDTAESVHLGRPSSAAEGEILSAVSEQDALDDWADILYDEDWNDVDLSEWEDIQKEMAVASNSPVEPIDARLVNVSHLDHELQVLFSKADLRTINEMHKVYLPAFQAEKTLKVTPEAYYESEPDTLSCCSEIVDSEAEARMERRAYEINMAQIFEVLSKNVGHIQNYAMFDRNSLHQIAASKALKKQKEELGGVIRFIGQLMETPEKMSKVIQHSREIFIPIMQKVYKVVHLDRERILAKNVANSREGFAGRPAAGFFILLLFNEGCHPVVTLDILNSLVDYLNFCVFNCLPEYEDGFEENIQEIYNSHKVKKEQCRLNKKALWRHDKTSFKSREVFHDDIGSSDENK